MTTLSEYLSADFDLPDDDEARQAWRIEVERQAHWAMRRLAEIESEKAAIRREANDEQERIDEWVAGKVGPLERDAAFFRNQLEFWAAGERERDPKRKTLTFPHGRVSTRSVGATVKVTDPEAFIGWAREYAPDLIDIPEPKARPLVAEVKKLIDGDVVLAPTGEIVPGVEVEPAHVSFTITPGVMA